MPQVLRPPTWQRVLAPAAAIVLTALTVTAAMEFDGWLHLGWAAASMVGVVTVLRGVPIYAWWKRAQTSSVPCAGPGPRA